MKFLVDPIKQIILDRENWFSPPDLNGSSYLAADIIKDNPSNWSSLTMPRAMGMEETRAKQVGRLIRAATHERDTVFLHETENEVIILVRNDVLEKARTPNVIRTSLN